MILSRLAGAQGRKDEEPNKAIGRELAESEDTASIQLIADHLWDEDKRVRTDCISVLEEIGRQNPALIATYAEDFIKLLGSKHNRLVWQAMENLALVAALRAELILAHFSDIVGAIETGSVITRDHGIKTLANAAAVDKACNQAFLPFLFDQLRTCRPKSVAQYAESTNVAIRDDTRGAFEDILTMRMNELSAAQARRVKKLIR